MSNRGAAALILCLFAIGCRTDPNRALREQELRLMEDRVYQLEECVREYQAALAVSERDNLQLRCGCAEPPLTNRSSVDDPYSSYSGTPHAGTPGADSKTATQTPSRRRARSTGPTTISKPPSARNTQPLQPLEVETGDPGSRFSLPRNPATENERIEPEPRNDQTRQMISPLGSRVGADAGNDQTDVPATQSDSKVKRVALAKLATGGYDAEPEAGDEGITLILRPLDAGGKLVRAAAPVAVVVMDPELSGDEARVARWDFSVDEVTRSFRRSGLSEGIHLNMRWPAAPPVHPDLMLFVRYTTRDGRHLETDQTIRIDPPDPQAASQGKRPDSGGSSAEEPARTDPSVDHPLDTPRKIVPGTLPAADVARQRKPEPRVATRPDHSLPQWSPTR